MQKPTLTPGGWHPPTEEQKPTHVGFYDSTTWNPHRRDQVVPSPIRTYWNGKEWLWDKGGIPCKFQDRYWQGTIEVNEAAQMDRPKTIIASQGGTIELVEIVKREKGELHYRCIGSNNVQILRTRGPQYRREFKTTDEAIKWINSHQKAKGTT